MTQQTTASLAASTGPQPGMPRFTSVGRGFHPGEVTDFVHRLFQRIEELERRAAPVVERAAESPAGHELIVDILKIAAQQAEGERASARADAAQSRSQAQAESEGLLAGARQQADAILANARSDAGRQLDKASAEATAVTEGAARRMDAVRQVHAESLRRLTAINEVTGTALAAERERGSLDDEVSRAMSTGLAVQPPAAPGASRN